MSLEIIQKTPSGAVNPTPLVFVHGAWHGAWCWNEHFLPYFVEQGYTVLAFSFRGHGTSAGRERLRWHRIRDYVTDLKSIVVGLPTPPVLIGHSMGGLVVQKYLEQHPARAGVLLASVPTRGALGATLRYARRHPLQFLKGNATLSLYPLIETPELTRDAFFSASLPEDSLSRYFTQMQDESYSAFLDMIAFALPKPAHVKTPLLVLGAANDTLFPPGEIQATARAYRTEATIFPDMAHDMMLEADWQRVAEYILKWITTQTQ